MRTNFSKALDALKDAGYHVRRALLSGDPQFYVKGPDDAEPRFLTMNQVEDEARKHGWSPPEATEGD